MSRIYYPLFDPNNPPADVFFGHQEFLPDTSTPTHTHPWGQLQLISGGILELDVEGERFLTPSQYAIWVPPTLSHASYMRRSLSYCSVNITRPLADRLPSTPTLLTVTPLIQAIVNEFRQAKKTCADTPELKRLIDVLMDQLISATASTLFLPSSRDKLLAPILQGLEKNPCDNRTLAQWATIVHTTERTLARHCKRELGMSFTEWRQRIRYLHSLDLLKEQYSVKEIALTLGYHQTSPFIAMFKKHAGCTPEQYRSGCVLGQRP